MKRKILLVISALVIIGLGAASYYFLVARSPEAQRDRYLKKGHEYVAQGKVNEGVIMFKNALKADPKSAEAYYELGLALLRRSDFSGAFGAFRRAADLKPSMTEAKYHMGNLYVLGGDVPHAKEQLDQIRARDQNSFEARSLAAEIAVAQKDLDTALKELQEALKAPKRPRSDIARIYGNIGTVYFVKKDFKAAEAANRKALEIEPGFIQARVALTRLYLATGQQEKAEEELLVATKADPENEALLHVLGDFYSTTRRLDEFEKLYRDFLQKKPDSLSAKKRMAELFFLKGDLKQARTYTEAILKAEPGDTDGRYLRGRLYLAEKNYPKAMEDFTSVARNAPQFAPGFYYLALVQVQSNQIDQAKSSFMKATELNPLWPQPRLALAQIYLASGDPDLTLQESGKVLETQPNNQSALVMSGAARLRKGETAKALELLKKAQQLNPKNPVPYVNIGTAYLLQKNYAAALKEYEEALKLDPDQIAALGSIARVYVLQGNLKAALERAQQQLTKTKNQAVVYQLLGQLSLEGKNYAEGVKHLENAVQSDPNLFSAYLLLGNAYAAQEKFDQAIGEYQKLIQKEPHSLPPYMFLGILYDLKKQPAKANEYYQKALDINKNFAPAANNLAWNYAEQGGSLDVALGLAQKAREISPESPQIADTLGWIYYKKGAYSSAVDLLKESSEKLQHNNPTVLYHLGLAYYRGGEKSLAREALNKALKIGGAFQGAEETKRTLAQIDAPKK